MKQCLSCSTLFQSQGWTCPHCHFEPETKQGFLTFAPELAEENNGYDISFFQGLARLEGGHFWFESRNNLIAWALRRYFPSMTHFLEIGCGTGFVLRGINRSLPSLRLDGTDIYTEGLTFAQARVPSAEFYQLDGQRIPFNTEFDTVGAFDVLEHIDDDQAVLCQIAKALQPGGGLILTVPQHRLLWSRIDDLSYHKRRYSREDLVTKVEAADFEILNVTSFVSLLLPAMCLARLLRMRQGSRFDKFAEFKISRPVNFLLRQMMRIEFALIRSGVAFGAGGSLFLVARLKLSR